MIRSLIVDDEPLVRERLRTLLAEHADMQVVGELGDGPSALDAARELTPDVVFLDIQMPGLSGLEVAEVWRSEGSLPIIIFVTAFDQFALEAFRLHALDYLTKPIDPERFATCLDRVRELHRLANRDSLEQRIEAVIAMHERRRSVKTHLVVREDAHTLYGFMSAAERDLFRLLINTVSGIGPKIALNVLSGISVTAFRGAVANGDVKALSQISGVGRKTAERIIVELKDKIGAAGAWEAASAQRALSPEDQKVNDAVLALMALGFKQLEAHDAVRKVQSTLGTQATVEDLVRACLKKGA